uniref:NADH dehydrogenase subunit 1 n=1 Tax=Coccus hesperidum TaxID=538890 RepID=UPI002E779D97|nr:NADH dehydrogenase subunit 1 [Coccus hesperidum]WRH36489.1 NADH dehydrogenase subunit 1 [Coccus hesperidum]
MIHFFYIFLLHFMLSVGFYMFLERKYLGFSHNRYGPNKVMFKGYFQFVYDMLKLFFKFNFNFYSIFFLFYFLIPMLLFFNIILMWLLLPLSGFFLNKEISLIYLIVLMVLKMFYMVLMVYFIMSVYCYLSMIRMLIQVISYDIIIIIIIIVNFLIYLEFDFKMFFYNFQLISMMYSFTVLLVWLVSIMVELLRLPFDFYEGESELVSGFNVEYGSLMFLFLVLVEYMEIIYFVYITLMMFVYINYYDIFWSLIFFFFLFVLVWFRVFFVRYRLDKMLFLLWKFIFPFIMFQVFIYFFLNLF